jgi:NADH-quinone oxidoreductase subunit E
MAVRRLYPDQPASFSFTPENLEWARKVMAKYPEGKQASAIIPLLWRAQEQHGGWLPEPAIRAVCDMLGMAHIRGLEIATFYTMFQLGPVGTKAHIQVCGTTPCMLNGARALIDVCKRHISEEPHHPNADGTLSWEEVECIGNCANAPVVQVYKDTYEDLTPASLESLIEGFVAGKPPKPGSQIGRKASCPAGGPTTLTDASLYDGSQIGAWRSRFDNEEPPLTPPRSLSSAAVVEDAPPPETPPKAPSLHPAQLTALANAGLVKELEARGTGKPLSADELEQLKLTFARKGLQAGSDTSKEPKE